MMEAEELPVGWETAELSEICLINPTIDKSAIADDLAVSFVPMPAVEAESGGIDVSATRKFGEVKKGYTPFREGDVLFAKITPCMENGKMAVVPALHNGLGFGSTEFHVLRAYPGISPRFIYYFVSSRAFRHLAEHNMSGAVGQRRVTTPYLSACKIPVPPTAEQHRIVAKIEELFSELDQGVASLKTAREQLKVYRQSLLKNAFEGKLTAAWRAAHGDQLETATALQQRIARERQARYQQQLAEWQTAGQPGPKPKSPKPMLPLTAEELAELPELPTGWGWVRFGELFNVFVGSTPSRKRNDFWGGEIPWVSSGEVAFCRIRDTKEKISAEGFANASTELHPPGTVMLAMIGEGKTRGQAAILDVAAAHNQNTAAIRVSEAGCSAEFVYQYLVYQYEITRKIGSGNNQKALNKERVSELLLPLCGLDEMAEVVSKIDEKLSEADQLDQTLATALQQADALRQSILKKAFHGQLVEQDKNEEPATALLERIRAARSANQPARRGRSASSQL